MLESILNGNIFGSSLMSGMQGQTNGASDAVSARDEQKAKSPAAMPAMEAGRADYLAAARYSKAETFSLDLTTKEGDKVTINFASASDMQASYGATRDGQGGSASSFSVSRNEASAFEFSVDGDLNEDELKAIESMIQDISRIADDFFGGDVQSAFEKASEFQMDSSQLSSMSLEMTRTESFAAASAYQEVQNNGMAGGLGKIGQMASLLGDQRQEGGLKFVDEIASLQEQILQSLVEQDSRYKDANEEQQSKFDQNRDILTSLVE